MTNAQKQVRIVCLPISNFTMVIRLALRSQIFLNLSEMMLRLSDIPLYCLLFIIGKIHLFGKNITKAMMFIVNCMKQRIFCLLTNILKVRVKIQKLLEKPCQKELEGKQFLKKRLQLSRFRNWDLKRKYFFICCLGKIGGKRY